MKAGIGILAILLLTNPAMCQTTIFGKIIDNKKQPLQGVSVSIKDSYDGGTSDSTGRYSFTTSEKGTKVLVASMLGYKTFEQTVIIAAENHFDFQLREEVSEMKAVVITAGTFEASDAKRATVLSSMDVVTTASANADVTGALRTLPGTQTVGESEGLFVRGGTASETKVFIDGTLVNNFFYTSVPDIAQRGRFSPFLFKGTVFSTGGYSALYGQGLSSALVLESVDLPERTSASIGVSTVGISGGYSQLSTDKKSSWGVNGAYTNLWPYFQIVQQKPDYFRVPALENMEGNFRIKTSKTGIIKFYTYFNHNIIGMRNPDIDSMELKDAFQLENMNWYSNLSWSEKLGKKWKMHLGVSYSTNIDHIEYQLQDQGNNQIVISDTPFFLKNYKLKNIANLADIKAVFERRLFGLSAIRFGAEYMRSFDKSDFENAYVKNANREYNDNFSSVFAETDLYITNDLAAKLGGRFEHSGYLDLSDIAPRISLAYKVGRQAQVSAAYGIFYQKPDRNYLLFQSTLRYQKATHYILNYQKLTKDYTFRVEAYYKKYEDLIKTFPDTVNTGYGEARGVDFFWRDKKTLKNVDYWVSYSYIDTKRDYLNYPMAMQPNFVANHTASLVVKKFVTNLKLGINGSYTFATGRPYYDIRPDFSADKFVINDQGKTISYNNLSFSLNYLPKLGKPNTKTFIVWVFSINNVLGTKQVFGYNYSFDGQNKQPILPTAKRFFFLGCFLSFGIDRSQDAINNNL